MNAVRHFILLIFSAVLFSGCMSVPYPEKVEIESSLADYASLRKAAFGTLDHVVDEASLDRSIQALENVAVYQADLEVLAQLSNLYIFKGAVYDDRVGDKRRSFVQALSYAENAMMIDPEFCRRIEQGDAVWDAVDSLDESYVSAMSFWMTALFYQFDECINKLVKPFNLRWVRRAETVLSHAYALDADWGGGQLHFTYGIYYLMPKIAGGDMVKSEFYFDRAVEAGPEWLLSRWGRAKYFYRKTGEGGAMKRDLEWVIGQDPDRTPGPVYWNRFCVEDARALLNGIHE